MYKSRISAWGLDKNRKDKEMRFIITKVARSGNGTLTFHIRNKEETYESAVLYFKRRGFTIDDVLAERAASRTPPAVTYIPREQTAASPSMITPSTPRDLAVPEQVLHIISTYVDGMFDGRKWLSNSEHGLVFSASCADDAMKDTLDEFSDLLVDHFCEALRLFEQRRYNEFQHAYGRAIDCIEPLVKFEDPLLLGSLLEILMRSIHIKKQEVAALVLRLLAEFARNHHGPGSALFRFCSLLAGTNASTLREVISRSAAVVHGGFASKLGSYHCICPLLWSTYAYSQALSQDVDGIVREYRHFVSEFTCELPIGDRRAVQVRLGFAGFLCFAGKFAEGAENARQAVDFNAVATKQSVDSDKYKVALSAFGYNYLGDCEYELGNFKEAIVRKKDAIATLQSCTKEGDPYFESNILHLRELEDELTTWEGQLTQLANSTPSASAEEEIDQPL